MKKLSQNIEAEQTDQINLFDAASKHLENIVTLAELVEGCGETKRPAHRTFVNSARMILSETDELHEVLKKLVEKM